MRADQGLGWRPAAVRALGSILSPMIKSGIYLIVCEANEAVYVGSSMNLSKRWSVHRVALSRGDHENMRLQRTWDKYGGASFRFDVLQRVQLDSVALLALEQDYIDAVWHLSGRMNQQRVAGAGMRGLKHSEETLQKMRGRVPHNKGKRASPEECAKNAAGHRGKKASLETREKMSRASRGRTHSAEAKAKLSAYRRGKKGISPSAETRARISAANKGLVKSPETCAKLSAAHAHRRVAVDRVDLETGEAVRFESLHAAEKEGFRATSICACLKGKRKSHGGFGWVTST